jgi:hypothetical protein
MSVAAQADRQSPIMWWSNTLRGRFLLKGRRPGQGFWSQTSSRKNRRSAAQPSGGGEGSSSIGANATWVVAERGSAVRQPLRMQPIEPLHEGGILPPADAVGTGEGPTVQAVAQPDPTRRPAGPTVQQAEIEEQVDLVEEQPSSGSAPLAPNPGQGSRWWWYQGSPAPAGRVGPGYGSRGRGRPRHPVTLGVWG